MNRLPYCITAVLLPLLWIFPAAGPMPAAAGPSPDSGIIRLAFEQNRVSVELVNADIQTVVARFTRETGVSVIAGPGVAGRVTAAFTDLPVDAAIARICESRAMVYEYLPEKKAYRLLRAGVFAEGGAEARESADRASLAESDPAPPAGREPASAPGAESNATEVAEDAPPERDSRGRLLYKPGELLVQLAPEAAAGAVAQLHAALGSRVLRRYDRRRVQTVALAPGMNASGAMARYRESGLVSHVERHALRYPSLEPNDPLYSDLWGMAKIAAPRAWDILTGDPGVIVAVIDTGVDYLHPDLLDNVWGNPGEIAGDGQDNDTNTYVDDKYGYDFADNDSSPLDGSVSGHGTHVAGIVAAVGDNGTGVTGVAWTARIMALKVQSTGSSTIETDAVIEALDYAVANGAKVVNCSFGGEAFSQLERKAFERLEAAGILAACAAGNDGRNIDDPGNAVYPAGYDVSAIVSVGASTQTDGLASFSNWGQTSVDLLAPGVSIESTVPSDNSSTEAYVASGGDTFLAIGMLFAGTTSAAGVTGQLVDCGLGYPEDIPAGVSGNIALIERGTLYFSEKVANAMAKEAIGVVIFNNVVDSLDQNGGTLQGPHVPAWIPAVSVTKADGEALLTRVGQPATLVNQVLITGDAYTYLQGTSMAAPAVSGAAALLFAADPGLSNAAVKAALLDHADPIAAAADITVSGGRLNVWRSVCRVTNAPGDVTCDGTVDLADAITSLKLVAGRGADPLSPFPDLVDVDGDKSIGLAEAMFVLQSIAGVRE